MPDMVTLTFFRLIGYLYATSDFRHAIVIPFYLLLAMILQQSVLSSIKDIVIGLYLASFYYKCQKDAKRYAPEVINYLSFVLSLLDHTNEAAATTHEPVRSFHPERKI